MKYHKLEQSPLFSLLSGNRIHSYSCKNDQYNMESIALKSCNDRVGKHSPSEGTGMTIKNPHIGSASKLLLRSTTTAFLYFSTAIAFAADYYVGPNGNASWSSCTSIGTYCSPQTAMQNARAGDTVYFRGGTYNITGPRTPYHGLLEPRNNGTQSNPIVFIAYDNEVPTISVECTSQKISVLLLALMKRIT